LLDVVLARISVFKTSLYYGPCRLEAIAGGDCQERQASKTKIPGWRRGRPWFPMVASSCSKPFPVFSELLKHKQQYVKAR
jgi:hypothetical protein